MAFLTQSTAQGQSTDRNAPQTVHRDCTFINLEQLSHAVCCMFTSPPRLIPHLHCKVFTKDMKLSFLLSLTPNLPPCVRISNTCGTFPSILCALLEKAIYCLNQEHLINSKWQDLFASRQRISAGWGKPPEHLGPTISLTPVRPRAETHQRISKFQITSCCDPCQWAGMFSPGTLTPSVSVSGGELPGCSTHLYIYSKVNSLFTLRGFNLAQGRTKQGHWQWRNDKDIVSSSAEDHYPHRKNKINSLHWPSNTQTPFQSDLNNGCSLFNMWRLLQL